ncbi:hypothetical protein C8R44DRAFT_203372 [Mycena epipterygia]|nr:hypothetical protein C8R44DRAFT_203372 [Mycena epipterygia]
MRKGRICRSRCVDLLLRHLFWSLLPSLIFSTRSLVPSTSAVHYPTFILFRWSPIAVHSLSARSPIFFSVLPSLLPICICALAILFVYDMCPMLIHFCRSYGASRVNKHPRRARHGPRRQTGQSTARESAFKYSRSPWIPLNKSTTPLPFVYSVHIRPVPYHPKLPGFQLSSSILHPSQIAASKSNVAKLGLTMMIAHVVLRGCTCECSRCSS